MVFSPTFVSEIFLAEHRQDTDSGAAFEGGKWGDRPRPHS